MNGSLSQAGQGEAVAWQLTDDEVTLCHSNAVLAKKHDGTDPSFTTLPSREIHAAIAAKLHAAQPAPAVPAGWISVADEMPSQGALVLAYCKGDAYPDSAIWSQPKGWSFGDVADQYWDEVQKPVTHWMPMPPIPLAPKPAKRCDYPDCTKACGDAKGFCHKAALLSAAPKP